LIEQLQLLLIFFVRYPRLDPLFSFNELFVMYNVVLFTLFARPLFFEVYEAVIDRKSLVYYTT